MPLFPETLAAFLDRRMNNKKTHFIVLLKIKWKNTYLVRKAYDIKRVRYLAEMEYSKSWCRFELAAFLKKDLI